MPMKNGKTVPPQEFETFGKGSRLGREYRKKRKLPSKSKSKMGKRKMSNEVPKPGSSRGMVY